MQNTNKNTYISNLQDTVSDALYSNSSYRGHISELRKYAEYVIRMLLKIDPKEKITLDQKDIRKRIGKLPNGGYALEKINRIKQYGDKCSHSQETIAAEKEYNYTHTALIELMAFLFINYFDNYKFGTNRPVLFAFSLLPPKFRCTVLDFLYKKYPDNMDVIDKYSLAILKAYGYNEALKWLEDNKTYLTKLSTVKNELLKPLQEMGSISGNMYDWCKYKIDTLNSQNLTPMYKTFEEAKKYYLEHGILPATSDENIEFNKIMEFMYTGRQTTCEETKPPFIVLNVIG